MAHPIRPDSYEEISNFYTATVYEKGAEVVRMLHTLLGEHGFMAGMRLYFERHDGSAATCDDFVNAMADANQRDLTQFKRWYEQAGTPNLEWRADYDGSSRTLNLHFKQSNPHVGIELAHPHPKPPLHIPILLGLISKEGTPVKLQVDQNATSFVKQPPSSLSPTSASGISVYIGKSDGSGSVFTGFVRHLKIFNRYRSIG